MTDSDAVQDGIDSDSEQEDDGRQRRWYVLVAVVLALLLLLCACATVTELWMVGSSEQARFVARNLECLQCHVELIPDLRKPTVHNPFALRQCTTCHTPHGSEVKVTVTRGPRELVERYKTLVQWLPLRWWMALSQRTVNVTKTAQGVSTTSSVKAEGGPSYLIMDGNDLCWTCHGSMGSKLSDAYQHYPFASGQCTGCHDPHASDQRSAAHPVLRRAVLHVPPHRR